MIPNLKGKLNSLPKVEIKKELAPIRDFECSVYETSFDLSMKENGYIADFIALGTNYLKIACRISDNIDIAPEEIVFFDTETTGIAGGTGTVAFLIGVGRIEGDKFIVRQFLMNDYHQEPSVLAQFAQTLTGAKAVATYNGKSFDAPLIKTRSIMNRISIELDEYIHFDLLHACRRIYKLRLVRMKLIDVEEHILNVVREDDIPGAEIPEIFFRYLKYGEKQLLDKVIEHNLNDIVSLAKISGVLSLTYAHPDQSLHTEDKYCIARTLYSMSRYAAAESILESIKEDLKPAKIDLAYLKRKNGEYDQAVTLFDELAKESRFNIKYEIETAKIMEHQLKEYELAVNYTKRAKEKIFNNRLLGIKLDIMDDVETRLKRLISKIEREK